MTRTRSWTALALAVSSLALTSCSSSHEDTVRELVSVEETILELSPVLGGFGRAIRDIQMPDPAADGDWKSLLQSVAYFENASFKIVDGEFADGGFASDVVFHAFARTRSKSWRAIDAHVDMLWKREDPEQPWQVAGWKTRDMTAKDTPRRFFREVSGFALPLADDHEIARRSHHEEHIVRLYRQGETNLPQTIFGDYFRPDAAGQHPGLSVVDVDRDGFDDLYVTVRYGRNFLLRNRGDGTFVEAAEEYGLDVSGLSSCSIFADFDNDGDDDLFLGRTFERSRLYENRDGRFVERSSDLAAAPLPYLVSSAAAADYNGDGLLDLYVCVYGLPGRALRNQALANAILPAGQAEEVFRRVREGKASDLYLEAVGPPNVLLVNRGGRFEVAPESEQVSQWLNALQATWADFDDDGDPDLYVSNDYAPDALFRNDGPDGFTEITRQTGGDAMMGFGMGASWGDYDGDGRQDLYVSNMFSKAGKRITKRISGIDARFVRSAEGNLLFRNAGGKFELVSGLEPPTLTVAKAGWSWGGQFLDVDNDADLDLYVSSGYYTAPSAIATQIDL